MTKDRLLAFSDGVFAILITILVLEFTVPKFQTGHLLSAMIQQWPILVAYIVSYFYVGTLWLFHHDYFQALKAIDRKLNLINLLMLFSITLINYPMALVAETLSRGNNSDIEVSFIAYAVIALFISGTFQLLYVYIG
ncbi:TMEM175 family protein [Companilactobacillus muriivasis]|uniref:TMEM175 family protein n=1 Tax=Companilactobacillus muriivasis TaxID=3081444 RepID=UPI0030C77736